MFFTEILIFPKSNRMKTRFLIVVSILLLIAVYFLGKKNGTTETRETFIENVATIKQIAELAALEVKGTTTITLSNASQDSGWWTGLRNYLVENTLQVTVPYTAKFGVDIAQGNCNVAIKDSTVQIGLPACKLLSLQLRLDELETMNHTGVFASTTIQDLANAEKAMYQQVLQQLSSDTSMINQSQKHTQDIFNTIYAPAGYHVVCNFKN
jgi:uncharacterized protein DUF4230